MKTILRLTPQDHGRRVTAEEWESAQLDDKLWKYEVIDGVIHVSPPAGFGHDVVADWLHRVFVLYRLEHPAVVTRISQHGRVRVPDRPELTEPQPDFSLYCLPTDLDPNETTWADVEPFLVVEILSEGTQAKETVRNVGLYLQVPGIREYWIVDPTADARRPSLRVYRRRGTRWQNPIDVAFGETYQSPRLLPGFTLTVDPAT